MGTDRTSWFDALSAPPPVPPGTRIRLLEMPNDPDPVPVGSTGTVTEGSNGAQLWITWDTGRSLLLLVGVDRYEVITRDADGYCTQCGEPHESDTCPIWTNP